LKQIFFYQQTWHDPSPTNHLNHKTNNKSKNKTNKTKQNKTDSTTNITPHATKTSKMTIGIEERLGKRNITQKKYIQNLENIPYYESESIHRRINRNDHNKE
jgi:hypothetical protein